MDARTSLLEKNPPSKCYLTPEMTPIQRYNLFVSCYNMPCNIVDSISLQSMPQSQTYDFLFNISTHLRGKIIFVILCIVPFVNFIPFLFAAFFAYFYWASLRVHQKNVQKIGDPFRRMTFDPQVCFNMGCDYYFFTIELKQLQGFSLNYQENVSERLKLRKERGKTNVMIYNANFWASYNYFQKWKVYHYSPLAISFVTAITFNTVCINPEQPNNQNRFQIFCLFFIYKISSVINNMAYLNSNINLLRKKSPLPKNKHNLLKKIQKRIIFALLFLFLLSKSVFLFNMLMFIKFALLDIYNKISYTMNKNLVLVALAALIAGAALYATQINKDTAFDEWKAQYGANWAQGEQEYRRIIFQRNVDTINKHNADPSQTYKMGINQFTTMTDEEFFNIYLDPKPYVKEAFDETFVAPNAEIDWTAKGVVSAVKNQGSCGSCWAFSATGTLEASAKIKGQTVSLSEQQLVDCSTQYGNHGCNGGWPSSALNYVKDHGLALAAEYPYRAITGSCQRQGGSFKISSYSSASGCTGLTNSITSKPISVTVDATNWSKYSSGIFSNCSNGINHAVLLVGVVGGSWKIKNSWGTSWGEAGYIRLAGGNTCGVCAYAGVYPN